MYYYGNNLTNDHILVLEHAEMVIVYNRRSTSIQNEIKLQYYLSSVRHVLMHGHCTYMYVCMKKFSYLSCMICKKINFHSLHSVLTELLCKVRDHIGCLHKLSECTAMLDMLHSFAHAATLSNYGKLL